MMETLNSGLSQDSKEEKDMQFKNNLKPLQKNTRIRLNVFQSQISLRAWDNSGWLQILKFPWRKWGCVFISFMNFLKVIFIANFSWCKKVTKSISDKTTKSASLERF